MMGHNHGHDYHTDIWVAVLMVSGLTLYLVHWR
jgi:hypothetical protein